MSICKFNFLVEIPHHGKNITNSGLTLLFYQKAKREASYILGQLATKPVPFGSTLCHLYYNTMYIISWKELTKTLQADDLRHKLNFIHKNNYTVRIYILLSFMRLATVSDTIQRQSTYLMYKRKTKIYYNTGTLTALSVPLRLRHVVDL